MTGLLVWALGAMRLGVLSLALVVGPEIEDFAWDHGTHVTPAQAAMHNILMAQGMAHHHHPRPPAATRQAPVGDQSDVAVQAGAPARTFGSPFSTVDLPLVAQPKLTALQSIPSADDHRPGSHLFAPDSPPPEVLQAFPLIA